MPLFRRRARSIDPATPAGAETLAPALTSAERRRRLLLHAQRAGITGAFVVVILAGVSVYLATVGLTDCHRFEGDKVCVETKLHVFSTVTRTAISYRGGTRIRHGWRAEWHRSGEPWIEGLYRHGEKDGIWREHWPNGELRYEGEYDDGQRQGRETWWYANGNPEWTGTYNEHGLREGIDLWWWEDGTMRRRGTFTAGEKDGLFTVYNPDGELAFTVTHDPDQG